MESHRKPSSKGQVLEVLVYDSNAKQYDLENSSSLYIAVVVLELDIISLCYPGIFIPKRLSRIQPHIPRGLSFFVLETHF